MEKSTVCSHRALTLFMLFNSWPFADDRSLWQGSSWYETPRPVRAMSRVRARARVRAKTRLKFSKFRRRVLLALGLMLGLNTVINRVKSCGMQQSYSDMTQLKSQALSYLTLSLAEASFEP